MLLRAVLAGSVLTLVAGLTGPASAGGAEYGGGAADTGAAERAPTRTGVEQATRKQSLDTPSATMTLVTGDRVRLDVSPEGTQQAELLDPKDAGSQAGDTTLVQFQSGDDHYAIPASAMAYVGTTLDPRLFNLSYLARAQLDDAHTATLPVTITGAGAGATAATALPGVRLGQPAARPGAAPSALSRAAVIDKAAAGGFGRLLSGQWRASRSGGPALPAGRLPGIDHIALAAPAGVPATGPAPTLATAQAAAKEVGTDAGLAFHTLTIRLTDLGGQPGNAVVLVQNVDDMRLSFFLVGFVNDPVMVSVPAGTYSVGASIVTPKDPAPAFDTALVVNPQVEVRSATTVTLDARTAVPYEATLGFTPDAEITRRFDYLTYTRRSVRGGQFSIVGPNLLTTRLTRATPSTNPALYPSRLLASPSTTATKGVFGFEAGATLYPAKQTDPGYLLHFPHQGNIPSSLTYQVPREELTTVHRLIHVDAGCGGTRRATTQVASAWDGLVIKHAQAVPAGEQSAYVYSSEPELSQYRTDIGASCAPTRLSQFHPFTHGQRLEEVWGKGPAVPSPAAPSIEDLRSSIVQHSAVETMCSACRQGLVGLLHLMYYGDSDPTHYAPQNSGDSQLRLYRDGELALSSGPLGAGGLHPQGLSLPMLPGAADYRLEWKQGLNGRPADSGQTTRTVWTFRSSDADPNAVLPDTERCGHDRTVGCSFLPLLFVTYDLPLTVTNTARAGEPFELAFTVSRQEHQPAATGLSASVSVSYDDGTTWTEPQAATDQGDGRFTASVTHPTLAETTGRVAVRVQARDGAGNTVDQTIIRAYELSE